jgi:hypothetical protein
LQGLNDILGPIVVFDRIPLRFDTVSQLLELCLKGVVAHLDVVITAFDVHCCGLGDPGSKDHFHDLGAFFCRLFVELFRVFFIS